MRKGKCILIFINSLNGKKKQKKKSQLIPFLLDILCPYKDGGEQLTEDLILLWDTHNGQPFLKISFHTLHEHSFSFIS